MPLNSAPGITVQYHNAHRHSISIHTQNYINQGMDNVRFEGLTAVTMKNAIFLQEPHGVTSQKTAFFKA
jgi:hypothetical protein